MCPFKAVFTKTELEKIYNLPICIIFFFVIKLGILVTLCFDSVFGASSITTRGTRAHAQKFKGHVAQGVEADAGGGEQPEEGEDNLYPAPSGVGEVQGRGQDC